MTLNGINSLNHLLTWVDKTPTCRPLTFYRAALIVRGEPQAVRDCAEATPDRSAGDRAPKGSVLLDAESVVLRAPSGLHGQIDFVGTASRPDGATAARFADTVNIDAENQQRAAAFTHAPYHYERQFTVAAGKYDFQMAIGAGPRAVGKLGMPLEVEPWNAATFGMGGIAFSTQAQAVDPKSAEAGPILEGRTPLVAAGRRFVPAATNRFSRSTLLYFYTEVYDPALGGANSSPLDASRLTMGYRILDRGIGAVRLETGMGGVTGYVRLGNPVVPFATRLSLAQLPAGSYRLEVLAGHVSGGETVARTIDFELQ